MHTIEILTWSVRRSATAGDVKDPAPSSRIRVTGGPAGGWRVLGPSPEGPVYPNRPVPPPARSTRYTGPKNGPTPTQCAGAYQDQTNGGALSGLGIQMF